MYCLILLSDKTRRQCGKKTQTQEQYEREKEYIVRSEEPLVKIQKNRRGECSVRL